MEYGETYKLDLKYNIEFNKDFIIEKSGKKRQMISFVG